ncbi:MAG: class F sortase [Patescibacteria group bacterium]|nr:class F sortase [Patescibacteria group bacterium]
MKTVIVFAFAIFVFILFPGGTRSPVLPVPSIQVASAATAAPAASWLSIPAINLAAFIQPVGTDPDGSMSVPVIPNTVGWYENGTAPGAVGSAVLDAHVYLAFKRLKNLSTGNSIYVTQSDGSRLHFVVQSMKSYYYRAVPLQKLFTANDAARLNLITCAGKWLPDKGTYDHRLVIYAKLAGS